MKNAAWILVAAAGLALLAGCATPPARWHNPDVTQAEAEADYAACRSHARWRADSDIDVDSTIGVGADHSRRMAIYDAGRSERRMLAECMGRRGYVQVRNR